MKNPQEDNLLKGVRDASLKCFFLTTLIFITASCQIQKAQEADNNRLNVDSMTNLLVNQNSSVKDTKSFELTETVVDDSKIDVPLKNKIELRQFENSDETFVEIKFYSRNKNNQWQLKQNLKQIKYGSLKLEMQVKDFNNDGFNDVTFVSGIAARGANEIRDLFIYDKKNDRLVHIKNSGDYPNLKYNSRLNSMTAQRFYGGTSTDFVKIEGDLLKEFASVESIGNEKTVYSIDENGKKTILRKYRINGDEIFERFKNYNPLEIDEEW